MIQSIRVVLLLTAFLCLQATVAFGQDFPITVVGGGAASFFPVSNATPKELQKTYDVVVVGGGLAGLMASLYLTDNNKSVLLVEKEDHMGGLASANMAGLIYDRGAAYWTDPFAEELRLLQHIGLGDYEKLFPIPEPIDSYFWNGTLYKGIWDDETLKSLPASFEVFRYELKMADNSNQIPNQPFEDFTKYGGSMILDSYNTTQWINMMPDLMKKDIQNQDRLKKRIAQLTKSMQTLKSHLQGFKPAEMSTAAYQDTSTKISNTQDQLDEATWLVDNGPRIWARFQDELKSGKLTGPTGMDGVVGLMDLYCRSALGTTGQYVSAMAFANFYISEIITRYTTPLGTAFAAKLMEDKLINRPELATLQVSSTVKSITQDAKGAQVIFQNGNDNFIARSSYVVFTAQIGLAPKIIDGLAKKSPEQAQLMSNLQYAHYSVHNVEVQGNPYRSSYDTWVRMPDYTEDDFTDFILGRWVELGGYNGYRDFKTDPPGNGILTIYHPLPAKWLQTQYDEADAIGIAKTAVARISSELAQMPSDDFQGPLKVVKVETNRWPLSVHIAVPGYYTNQVIKIRKPFGRVVFGDNNLGAPAFEEALFRGHCAANNVLLKMTKSFKNESWSRCPLDN